LAETDPCLVNDFNLVSQLELAYYVKSTKSADIFIENLFKQTNKNQYKELIMEILPTILK